MGVEERISFCRICSGGCGVRLTVDENEKILSVRGDPDSPLTAGYACFKGLQAAESHQGPGRLLHTLKRQADGSYARMDSGTGRRRWRRSAAMAVSSISLLISCTAAS